MKRFKNSLCNKNNLYGLVYAYEHLILEIVCFCFLSRLSNSLFIWLVPFLYDGFAFIPQALIGYIKDKYPRFNEGLLGMIFLFIGIFLFSFMSFNRFIILFIISIANALLHVEGAYNTIMCSKGKLSPSAIFVGFGSIGVILGRVIAKTMMPTWFLLILIITMLPCLLFGTKAVNEKSNCNSYNYTRNKVDSFTVIILATVVVMVRGYIGYRIPSSWNITTWHTVLLFVTMGIGKILGGILSDAFGLRKIANISTCLSLPFLLLGNNNMIISLIGIMLFSMSMSITLAICVSVLKKNPGLAFGFTTIGLTLGTIPIFFVTIDDAIFNTILIILLTIICFIILNYLLWEDKHEMDL